MSDVLIIGGGPAGSALGCYLSKAGVSNTIFESAVHPRAHVGESMVTASTRVFSELGFLETMEFQPTSFVRRDQVLFVIEQEPFEAQLAATEGRVVQDLIAIYKAVGGGWAEDAEQHETCWATSSFSADNRWVNTV